MANAGNRNQDLRKGWIYTLRGEPKAAWRTVEGFYRDVVPKRPGKDFMIVEDLNGRFAAEEIRPSMGDGFAFYHSGRRAFPAGDPFGKRPRISLVGEILGISWLGDTIIQVCVGVNTALAAALRARPLVRDESTEEIFERCGIGAAAGRGAPKVFHADPIAWYLIETNLELLAGLAARRKAAT